MFEIKIIKEIIKNIIKNISLIIISPLIIILMIYILAINGDSAGDNLEHYKEIMYAENISSIQEGLEKGIIVAGLFFQSYLLSIPIMIIKDILYNTYKSQKNLLKLGIYSIISSLAFIWLLIFIQYKFGLIRYLLVGKLSMILDLLISFIFLLKFIKIKQIIKSKDKMLKENAIIVILNNLYINKNYKYKMILRKFILIISLFIIIILIINEFIHYLYKNSYISMNFSIIINIIYLMIVLQNFISYNKLILILKNIRDYDFDNGKTYNDAKRNFWEKEDISILLMLLLNIEVIFFILYFRDFIILDAMDFCIFIILLLRFLIFYSIDRMIKNPN